MFSFKLIYLFQRSNWFNSTIYHRNPFCLFLYQLLHSSKYRCFHPSCKFNLHAKVLCKLIHSFQSDMFSFGHQQISFHLGCQFNIRAKLEFGINLSIHVFQSNSLRLVLQINTEITSACFYINYCIHRSIDVSNQVAKLICAQNWDIVKKKLCVNVQQKLLNRVLNRCDAITGPSTLTVQILRYAITASPNIFNV